MGYVTVEIRVRTFVDLPANARKELVIERALADIDGDITSHSLDVMRGTTGSEWQLRELRKAETARLAAWNAGKPIPVVQVPGSA